MNPFCYIWVILGLFLVLAEFAVPGFAIFFLGLSSIIVGILTVIWPTIPFWFAALLFSVFSLVLITTCRKYVSIVFKGRTEENRTDPDEDGIFGGLATVTEDIAPGCPGKVEFRGSLWEAVSDTEHKAGDLATVVSRENLTLRVK